jgi:hypothetical protein
LRNLRQSRALEARPSLRLNVTAVGAFLLLTEVTISKANFEVRQSDLAAAASSSYCLVIAGGIFNATVEMQGTDIATDSGIPGIRRHPSKSDEIHIKNISIVALWQQ